jgi:hypothetical protein
VTWTATQTAPSTPTATPSISPSASASPTQTPAPAQISGVYESGSGTFVFTGTGSPGDVVYIVEQPGSIVIGSGTVAADGSFAVSVTNPGLTAGDTLQAHAGSATGPSLGSASVQASSGSSPVASSPEAGGATVMTVSGGSPGEIITVIDQTTGQVLGSAPVGANGDAAVILDTPATPGHILQFLSDGQSIGTVTVGALGSAPTVTQGAVLVEGSVLTGTGTPGSTLQVVDVQGRVLGSTTVAADGSWSVPVSGAVQGVGVKVIQDGVARDLNQPALALGAEKAFTSTNVFKPLLGGSLDIGVKADADDSITVKIFSVAGETVRVVAALDVKAGILYGLKWDGKNDYGENVAAGLYVISISGGKTHILKKVVVLK